MAQRMSGSSGENPYGQRRRSPAPQRRRTPIERVQRAAAREPVDEYDAPQDEPLGEEAEPFQAPAGGVAGLPPQTVKFIAGGVILLALIGVIAAMALRSSAKKREKQAHLLAFRQKAVNLTYEAAKMAVEYFSSPQKKVPEAFYTHFRTDPQVVDVVIQHQPSGSVTFFPVAFAIDRKPDRAIEHPLLNPKPLPGTEVFETRGMVIIDMVEYPIRIYRQAIKDEKGKVLGRVAVMLFDL